jgi:hypothetical protein
VNSIFKRFSDFFKIYSAPQITSSRAISLTIYPKDVPLMRRLKDNGFLVSRIKSNSKSVGKVEIAAPVTISVSVPPLYIWLFVS